MKLFEVNLTKSFDVVIVAESDEAVCRALRDSPLEQWDLPPWQVITCDLIENAHTIRECDGLLAGQLPAGIVVDGILYAVEDQPEVMAVIEETIRAKKDKLWMDEHQLKLPGFN